MEADEVSALVAAGDNTPQSLVIARTRLSDSEKLDAEDGQCEGDHQCSGAGHLRADRRFAFLAECHVEEEAAGLEQHTGEEQESPDPPCGVAETGSFEQ